MVRQTSVTLLIFSFAPSLRENGEVGWQFPLVKDRSSGFRQLGSSPMRSHDITESSHDDTSEGSKDSEGESGASLAELYVSV